MFSLLSNIAKATVAVAVAPVALAVDIVTLPASADDFNRGAFDRTEKMLDAAGKAITDAVK